MTHPNPAGPHRASSAQLGTGHEAGVAVQPAARRGWPLTGGDGIPVDEPEGHVANALACLRASRDTCGWDDLPPEIRCELEQLDRRLTFALQGIRLLIAKQQGGLHLSTECSCVLDALGRTILPCVRHDLDDTGRRND